MTYPYKKDSAKAEIFSKIEPYSTFLHIHQLEMQSMDIQATVEELEDLNQLLRQHDKVQDDSIAQSSNHLAKNGCCLVEGNIVIL